MSRKALVSIADGIVENVIEVDETADEPYETPDGYTLIDAEGAYVGPGFTWDGNNFLFPYPTLTDMKQQKVSEIKKEAWNKLLPTDWYVIRQQETGGAIPSEIEIYRTAVRAASNDAEVAINAATTPEEVLAVSPAWPAQ